MWHHGAPSDCADSTACLFLLKDTKNLKNFNENPRELGIYGNNLMVPVSLPLSLSLSLTLSQLQLLMKPATYLSQQISARTHTNRFDTRPRWAPIAPEAYLVLALHLELALALALRLDAVHAISAIKPRRVESHWNWRGWAG